MSLPAGLTSNPSTSLRNNFGAELGFVFVVGANPLYVRGLGRWIASGNTATHVVALHNSGGTIVASVSVDTTKFTANTFGYVALTTPLILTAGATYYCYSAEVNGGDQWNDQQNYTFSSDIASISASFGFAAVSANQSYVPTNFIYSLTPGGQTSQIIS